MATTIKIKSSSVAAKVPEASSLQPAELAINLKDQKLYSKDVDGVVFEVGKDAAVDLGYTPAADKGTVTNTAGDDAELPLADSSNAGLLAPGDKDKLDEITINADGDLDIDGYVKLDDKGTQQTIEGGGGLEVNGHVIAGATELGNFTGVDASSDGTLTIVNRNGTNLIDATQTSGSTKTFVVDQDADLTTTGSVTTVFGTSGAQRGNVAPLNDWSVYPART